MIIILIILTVIAVIVLIASAITGAVKGRRAKSFEEAYAYLTLIEFIDRVFLMANLWASAKIFSFAICFMDIVTTGVFGSILLQFVLRANIHSLSAL